MRKFETGKGLLALKSRQLACACHVCSDIVKVEPWRRVEFYTTAGGDAAAVSTFARYCGRAATVITRKPHRVVVCVSIRREFAS
jgi:hypothetical protein